MKKIKVITTSVILGTLLMTGCSGGGTNNTGGVNNDNNNYQSNVDNNEISSFKNLESEIYRAENQDNEIFELINPISMPSNSDEDLLIPFKNGFVDIVTIGSEYKYDTFTYLRNGKDVSSQIQIEGTVDTNKVGEYILDYFVTDGNLKRGYKKHVFVVNNTAPTIKLIGDNVMETNVGDIIDIPYVTVYDRERNIDDVIVNSDVDFNKHGEYTISYEAIDKDGLSSSVERTVIVNEKDDLKKEVINYSSNTEDFQYSLFDYMNSPTQVVKTKIYKHNIFKNEVKRVNQDGVNHVDYTSKGIKLSVIDNSTLKLSLDNDSEETYLKKYVKLNDVITQNENGVNSCSLKDHYDTISLGGTDYNDVIEIECENKATAYYQKNKGLIVENIIGDTFYNEEGKTHTYSIKPKLENKSYNDDLVEENYLTADLLHVHDVYKKYHLSGKGIEVGIVDGGKVFENHVDLAGKVTNYNINGNNNEVSSHATHIAGTIASSGKNNIRAQGIAYNSTLNCMTYQELSGISSMKELFKKGSEISNHSYGSQNWNGGTYNYSSIALDKGVYENPYLIGVFAAGNERNNNGYPNYGIIDNESNSKNAITVGAVDENLELTNFSNTGPVRDNGRIKPDVVSNGSHIYSISIDEDGKSYRYGTGTSMATPTITGLIALMQEEYIKVNNQKMREDIAKGILVESAKDLGREGPDYEYGFGFPNALKCIDIIESMNTENNLVQDRTIDKNHYHSYKLEVDSYKEIKLTLSWIDPENTIYLEDDSYKLNTDLDLTIENENGVVVYSYTLDNDDPEKEAQQNKLNHVDNVEQIVTSLNKGHYKVIVRDHGMELTNQQPYSLISNTHLTFLKDVDMNNLDLNEFENFIFSSVQ